MNEQVRQFGVLVLGVAVVGGAVWTAVVKPMARRQAEARAALDAESEEIQRGRAVMADAGETDRVLAALKEQADEYEALWAVAAHASDLYETLRDFARKAGVEIERIEPRRVALHADAERVLKDYKLNVERAGYQIEVHGSFESIAAFVRAVQSGTGLSRIDTIRIGPGSTTDESRDAVRATISTSHVGVSGALSSFSDAEEGDA